MMERKWAHPTGGAPKTVHLVGLGPTHHDYDQQWLAPHTPDTLWQTDETWIINRGMFAINHDMAWVMDHIQGEAENFPIYGAKLWNHDKPIITSDNLDGWPAHVHAYPWDEIMTWLSLWPKTKWIDCYGIEREMAGPPVHVDWFHNSVPYIILYAAFIGVQKLYGWGLDYHHHKSARVEDGHPNVAYWAGLMEKAGLQVIPFDQSTFLGAHQRGWIYGYQRDPRQVAASRRQRFRMLSGIELEPAEGLAPPLDPPQV